MDIYDRSVATVGSENIDFSHKSPENNNIEFIGQGSFSCVFRPAIKCDNTIDPNNPNDRFFVSKISKKDKYIDNEIHISSIIQKINRYYHHFSPILENCDADLYKLSSTTASSIAFQKCDLFKKNDTIIEDSDDHLSDEISSSMEPYENTGLGADADGADNNVEYIYNKIRYVGHNDLYSYLENSKNNDFTTVKWRKNYALRAPFLLKNAWKDAFTYLSYSISLLSKNSIVHYDFKGNNVMVHDKHHTPIIIDFGLSIDINQTIRGSGSDVEERLKRAFYIYSTDYEVWCPEICFICYFTQERSSTRALFDAITIDDINTVCTDFMSNNEIFGEQYFNMNEQERETYHSTMREFFSEFLNKPATEAIIEITEKYYNTWDMYSLTVCFQGAVLLPVEYRKLISANPRDRV